jgi:hypothetical protein
MDTFPGCQGHVAVVAVVQSSFYTDSIRDVRKEGRGSPEGKLRFCWSDGGSDRRWQRATCEGAALQQPVWTWYQPVNSHRHHTQIFPLARMHQPSNGSKNHTNKYWEYVHSTHRQINHPPSTNCIKTSSVTNHTILLVGSIERPRTCARKKLAKGYCWLSVAD